MGARVCGHNAHKIYKSSIFHITVTVLPLSPSPLLPFFSLSSYYPSLSLSPLSSHLRLISFAEFRSFESLLCMPDAVNQLAFRLFDVENKGRITFGEGKGGREGREGMWGGREKRGRGGRGRRGGREEERGRW